MKIAELRETAGVKIARMEEIKAMSADEATAESKEERKAIVIELEAIYEEIQVEERAAAIDAKFAATAGPAVGKTEINVEEEERKMSIEVGTTREAIKPWESFGEQLVAIRRACTPGNTIDVRLNSENRAASGMNEMFSDK